MDLIKQDSTYITVNGIDLECEVFIYAEHEDSPPDFDYGNEVENLKELQRFERYELHNLCLKVVVSYKGFEFSDYLGQCFVRDDYWLNDILEHVDQADMIGNCKSYLQDDIEQLYNLLKGA